MTTIQKINDNKFIIENNNITIKTLFNDGKIWLTAREISEIYGSKKSNIKKGLNNIIINSNINQDLNIKKIYNEKKGKNETFYSLNFLLLLGYNSKHFKETKFLVNTNKLIKNYNLSRKYKLDNLFKNNLITKVIKYLNPILKI